MVTANNFGIFWIITLPITIFVLVSSSVWPSFTSIVAKQKNKVAWLHGHTVRTVFATSSKIAVALGTCVQYLGIMIRVTLGRETWGEGFAMWLQDRRLNRGTPGV